LAPWITLLESRAAGNAFYLSGMGLDQPAQNLLLMAQWTGRLVVALGVAVLIGYLAPRGWLRGDVVAAAGLVLGVVLVWWVPRTAWFQAARALPVVATLGVLCYGAVLARRRGGEREWVRAGLGLMLSTFALVLLGKMLLNARTYHYGFTLAMPASLLLVGWLTHTLPRWCERRASSAALVRAVGLALVGAAMLAHVSTSARMYARKTVPVGHGSDAFLADRRGLFVRPPCGSSSRTAPGRARWPCYRKGS
jgi:hypothetical protein